MRIICPEQREQLLGGDGPAHIERRGCQGAKRGSARDPNEPSKDRRWLHATFEKPDQHFRLVRSEESLPDILDLQCRRMMGQSRGRGLEHFRSEIVDEKTPDVGAGVGMANEFTYHVRRQITFHEDDSDVAFAHLG